MNGVVPIDTLKDYLSAVQMVCDRVPKFVLEAIYHIRLPSNYTPNAEVFLDCYCVSKG
jgi:large subunit GTPase 1